VKLALSGRIAEAEHVKEATVSVEELARLAVEVGYDALCLRPSQANVETSDERLREMRATLDQFGLNASMVTPDARIARQGGDPAANATLRDFEPALHVARALQAGLLRVALKGDDDIAWAQLAADAAREYGLRLVHQTHAATPFETLMDCQTMLRRIDRSNFGLTVEPANLALCGEDYGLDALRPIGRSIFNVYVQNVRSTPGGASAVSTNRGAVRYERLIVGDPGGIDLGKFFDALHALEYNGYVTAHQPAIESIAMESLAKRVHGALASFVQQPAR